MPAAQKGAGSTELRWITEAAGRMLLGALRDEIVQGNAFALRFAGIGCANAVGHEGSRCRW